MVNSPLKECGTGASPVRTTAGGGCATPAYDDERDFREPQPGVFRRAVNAKMACVAVLCAMAAGSTGCVTPEAQRVATYVHADLINFPVRRIVVVPFDGRECPAEARQVVTEALSLELQSALLCDVIPAPLTDERLVAEAGLWKRGRVDPEALIDARKTYGADAFLFGTLSQYKPYDPPIVGLKVRMLSARTGEVLWASEAIFDARRAEVRRAAMETMRNEGPKDWLSGDDMVFMSPRYFSRYVAREVVAPLSKQVNRGAFRAKGFPDAGGRFGEGTAFP